MKGASRWLDACASRGSANIALSSAARSEEFIDDVLNVRRVKEGSMGTRHRTKHGVFPAQIGLHARQIAASFAVTRKFDSHLRGAPPTDRPAVPRRLQTLPSFGGNMSARAVKIFPRSLSLERNSIHHGSFFESP